MGRITLPRRNPNRTRPNLSHSRLVLACSFLPLVAGLAFTLIASCVSASFLSDDRIHSLSSINGTFPNWPVKRVAEIPGDLVIGGLHMVHERQDKLICGPVMPQGGLQAAEVMLYTVDKVNELQVMPFNVTLGAHILDDCDRDTYGLQQAVDFIKVMTLAVFKSMLLKVLFKISFKCQRALLKPSLALLLKD
ncbi:hypothetical protein TCAL_17218 [Tigriopus californicus]|uniref:Receptor ligand binding region domain-containing protein n=1 Tax=Tigriopus californicus TaxID=6832 RepID=A0A553N6W7_TIGCA|nr:hypothetical protein TCAL_17218 [Tigriopus californicus]